MRDYGASRGLRRTPIAASSTVRVGENPDVSAHGRKLLSAPLLQTLCEHAAGNLRLLMNMANDLLAAACQQEREVIDEKLYFEVFALDPKPAKKS